MLKAGGVELDGMGYEGFYEIVLMMEVEKQLMMRMETKN